MKKFSIAALVTAVSFMATVGLASAQTYTATPTPTSTPMATASPSGQVQGASTTTVPSGAPATGHAQ
jgi:hypothetical protein